MAWHEHLVDDILPVIESMEQGMLDLSSFGLEHVPLAQVRVAEAEWLPAAARLQLGDGVAARRHLPPRGGVAEGGGVLREIGRAQLEEWEQDANRKRRDAMDALVMDEELD